MAGIKEVARLARVGINTVSRVINNRPGVAPETRARVQEAIEQLQYVPNEVARNFKLQTSSMVALFVPYVVNPYIAKLTYHIETELYKRNLKMMLCVSDAKPEKELEYLNLVKQNKVKGIIGLTYNDVNYFLDTRIPFVSVDRFVGKKVPSVSSDNEYGGRLAVQELIKAGCKNIVFVGDSGNVQSEVRLRRKGFKVACEEIGIEPKFHDRRGTAGYNHDDKEFIRAFFDKFPDADGVFAISDLMAIGLVSQAQDLSIEVPEQLKIIGFDGIQDHDYFDPYLSTIVQPIEQIAQKAVDLLLAKVADPKLRMDTVHLPVTYRQGRTT
jgi:LacI family transcriptional regulator